jgi:hypothetical protein
VGKFQNNELGFSPIELILVVVIVVLVVLVGVLVYKDNNKTKTTATTTTNTKANIVANDTSPQPDPALVLQRQEHVDSYINANTSSNYTAAYYTNLYNQGYISKSEYNTIQSGVGKYNSSTNTAYAKLICSNELPTSYSYAIPTISSNGITATIKMGETFSSGSTSNITENWVVNNNVWQLNSSNCPAS